MNERLIRDFRRSDMRPIMILQVLILTLWVAQWVEIALHGLFQKYGGLFGHVPTFLAVCLGAAVLMPVFSYMAGTLMLSCEEGFRARPKEKRRFVILAAFQALSDWYRVVTAFCLYMHLSGRWHIPELVSYGLLVAFVFSFYLHLIIALFAGRILARFVEEWKELVDLRMMS